MFLGTIGFLFLIVFIMLIMDPIADKVQSNKQDKEVDDKSRSKE